MKLPEIVSTSTIPADIPAPHASPEAFAQSWNATERGLQATAHAAGMVAGIAEQRNQLRARQQDLADKNSGLNAWAQYKALIDSYDADAENNKGADPEIVTKQRNEYRQTTEKGVTEGLSEGAKGHFARKQLDYEDHWQASGVKLYNRLYTDQQAGLYESTVGAARQSLMNAPLDDPLAFQRSSDDVLQAIEANRVLMGNKWAADEKNKWMKEVEAHTSKRGASMDEADARRRWDLPELRGEVIRDLTNGNKYRYMPPDQQIVLRNTLIKDVHAQTEQDRKDSDRDKKDRADANERGIVENVTARNYTKAQSFLDAAAQDISGEEMRSWQQYITKAQENKESDPDTRTRIQLQVYEATTPKQIAAAKTATRTAVGAGLLSADHGDKYLGHLQGVGTALDNRYEDKALAAYHQRRSDTQKLVTEALKITGPLAAIVPTAQATYSMALEDFNRNVPPDKQGGEAPEDWWNRTKATWVGHVQQAAAARVNEIQRDLGPYKDKAALMADRQKYTLPNGQLSADFYDKARMLKNLEDIQREMKRMSGQNLEPAKPESGTSKPSPGGKSLGY